MHGKYLHGTGTGTGTRVGVVGGRFIQREDEDGGGEKYTISV